MFSFFQNKILRNFRLKTNQQDCLGRRLTAALHNARAELLSRDVTAAMLVFPNNTSGKNAHVWNPEGRALVYSGKFGEIAFLTSKYFVFVFRQFVSRDDKFVANYTSST